MREKLSDKLLEWYDAHARTLPWRVSPADRKAGIVPDPYRVWLSEVMLQQTTVAAVKDYFHRFTELWPTVHDLAAAEDADVMAEWAGLGYYARARNLLKCARAVVSVHNGHFPNTREGLLSLPGIGPYTAGALASIAFDQPEVVVDGNVERVMSRLHNVQTSLPEAKPLLTDLARQMTPNLRPGDYAQAVMDLGATICTPKKPACGICPWRESCAARIDGTETTLPRKIPKKPKPVRIGYAYVARRADGAWLLETRPEKGLLGGMLGWPCSDWNDDPAPNAPIEASWTALNSEARHTFTHFHLRLSVNIARVGNDVSPCVGKFVSDQDFNPSSLPTVMRKVFDLASETLRTVDAVP